MLAAREKSKLGANPILGKVQLGANPILGKVQLGANPILGANPNPPIRNQSTRRELTRLSAERSRLLQVYFVYFKKFICFFQPISVSDVLETIKGKGIKCSAEQLKNFFDEQVRLNYCHPA